MQARKDVPEHAAEPDFGGEALPERGRVGISCLSPGPCRLLALCAMVRGLGKGHCDAHPLVTQVRAEASLSPVAGTPCAAACIVARSHTTTAEKPLCQAHLRVLHHQLESEKKMKRKDLHEKLGQRSAPQSAQKCVLEGDAVVQRKNLEDQNLVLHHQELECRRAAPQTTEAKNRKEPSALPPTVPPTAAQEPRYASLEPGNSDPQVDQRPTRLPRGSKSSANWSIICGTGRSRICTNGQTEPRSSMTRRTTLSCLPATSDRGAGRPPPGSSSRLKSSGWGAGGFRIFAV